MRQEWLVEGVMAERLVLQRLRPLRMQRGALALRLTNGAKNTTLLEPSSVAVVTKWQTRGRLSDATVPVGAVRLVPAREPGPGRGQH